MPNLKAGRLLREQWRDPNALAQELYSMLSQEQGRGQGSPHPQLNRVADERRKAAVAQYRNATRPVRVATALALKKKLREEAAPKTSEAHFPDVDRNASAPEPTDIHRRAQQTGFTAAARRVLDARSEALTRSGFAAPEKIEDHAAKPDVAPAHRFQQRPLSRAETPQPRPQIETQQFRPSQAKARQPQEATLASEFSSTYTTELIEAPQAFTPTDQPRSANPENYNVAAQEFPSLEGPSPFSEAVDPGHDFGKKDPEFDTPEIYKADPLDVPWAITGDRVAQTSGGGIPGLTVDKNKNSVPGKGSCTIYDFDGKTLVAGRPDDVFNLSKNKVAGGTFIQVKNIQGYWFVDWEDCPS